MKKGRKAKKLGRKRDARLMMLRNLATSVILYEKVTTTQAKAKAVQPLLEKKLSQSLKKDLHSQRLLLSFFTDKNAVKKIFSELVPSYKGKKSGFTRVLRVGYRAGDSAPKVQIQLIIPEELESKRKKKAEEEKKAKEESEKTKKPAKLPTKLLRKKAKVKVKTKVKEDPSKSA